MGTLQDYLNQLQAAIHDTNNADFSQATLISFINQARTRVALDTHCVRGFLSVTGGNALNTIPQQENYIYNGTLGGITVTQGGVNYTAPSVNITDPTGTGATAVAVVQGGVIDAINMTSWGTGYSNPSVTVTDATGSGAKVSPTVLLNVLDILSITVLWGDERITFGWLPFTAFQAFLRQITSQFSVPSVFTMHQGIQQAFIFQIPDQAYPMEWDIITLPMPLVNLADVDSQVIPPWNDAVQLFAAHLCYASLQNQAMADWYYSGNPQRPGKYDVRMKQLPATAFSRRIPNVYRTYAKMVKRL
jgi:hypothetical protein